MTDTSSGISPETLKPEARQFLERIGHFVIIFSMVENMMQRTLWHFAGVSYPIAPAIFQEHAQMPQVNTSNALQMLLGGLKTGLSPSKLLCSNLEN